jgi:hypothetical protein
MARTRTFTAQLWKRVRNVVHVEQAALEIRRLMPALIDRTYAKVAERLELVPDSDRCAHLQSSEAHESWLDEPEIWLRTELEICFPGLQYPVASAMARLALWALLDYMLDALQTARLVRMSARAAEKVVANMTRGDGDDEDDPGDDEDDPGDDMEGDDEEGPGDSCGDDEEDDVEEEGEEGAVGMGDALGDALDPFVHPVRGPSDRELVWMLERRWNREGTLVPPGPRTLLHLAADAAAVQGGAYLSTPMVLAAVQKLERKPNLLAALADLLAALARLQDVVQEAQISIGTRLLPSQAPEADVVAERACLLVTQHLDDLVFKVFRVKGTPGPAVTRVRMLRPNGPHVADDRDDHAAQTPHKRPRVSM